MREILRSPGAAAASVVRYRPPLPIVAVKVWTLSVAWAPTTA